MDAAEVIFLRCSKRADEGHQTTVLLLRGEAVVVVLQHRLPNVEIGRWIHQEDTEDVTHEFKMQNNPKMRARTESCLPNISVLHCGGGLVGWGG